MAKKRSKTPAPTLRARITHTLYLHIAEKDGKGIIDEIYLPSNHDNSMAGENSDLLDMIENALLFNRTRSEKGESRNHIVVALPLNFELPEHWDIRVPVPIIDGDGVLSGGSEPVPLLRPRFLLRPE